MDMKQITDRWPGPGAGSTGFLRRRMDAAQFTDVEFTTADNA